MLHAASEWGRSAIRAFSDLDVFIVLLCKRCKITYCRLVLRIVLSTYRWGKETVDFFNYFEALETWISGVYSFIKY